MSATVSSPVCPMPVNTGLVAPATARATTSVSKAARSARAPPPRTMAMTSQSLRLSTLRARAMAAGAWGPCTDTGTMRDAEAEPRAGELTEEVLTALGAGAGDQAHVHGEVGHAERTVAPEQPLGLEGAEQPGALGGHAPQQRGHVDLDEDETDLPLGSVQVERAPQHDDHALGQVDALLGQRVAQRRPRAAPALDVERGHAATRHGAPAPTRRRRVRPGSCSRCPDRWSEMCWISPRTHRWRFRGKAAPSAPSTSS